MADEAKKDNARNKAYTAATTALRDAHRDEFNDLLEAEYGKLGLTPRRRRTAEEIEAEAAAKAQAKAEKARMRALQKIAARQEEIEALRAEVESLGTVVEDDPMAVFSEE
jgi:hypothetical protein